MQRPAIVCPACWAIIPNEYVEWQVTRASCPRCNLLVSIYGEITPPNDTNGYPDALLARRPSEVDDAMPDRGVQIESRGRETLVKVGGFLGFFRKTLRIGTSGADFGGACVSIDEVRGVIPVQNVVWGLVQRNTGRSSFFEERYLDVTDCRWLTKVLFTNAEPKTIADFRTSGEAMRFSAKMNAALERARTHNESPYRS